MTDDEAIREAAVQVLRDQGRDLYWSDLWRESVSQVAMDAEVAYEDAMRVMEPLADKLFARTDEAWTLAVDDLFGKGTSGSAIADAAGFSLSREIALNLFEDRNGWLNVVERTADELEGKVENLAARGSDDGDPLFAMVRERMDGVKDRMADMVHHAVRGIARELFRP